MSENKHSRLNSYRRESEKYEKLTAREYINIKLKMIESAKNNPVNSMFVGEKGIFALILIEQMFRGDLAEIQRHTGVIDK